MPILFPSPYYGRRVSSLNVERSTLNVQRSTFKSATAGLFVGVMFVLALLSAPECLRAQAGTNHLSMSVPFPTVIGGSMSNILFQAASGLNITPTATALRNSPLGVDIQITSQTSSNAAVVQSAYGFQLSSDGGVTFAANHQLLALIPSGTSISNIVYRTNFSQALLGNANAIRISSVTNGNASSLVTSNVTLNYFY